MTTPGLMACTGRIINSMLYGFMDKPPLMRFAVTRDDLGGATGPHLSSESGSAILGQRSVGVPIQRPKCLLTMQDSRERSWTYHDAGSPKLFEYVLDLLAWVFQGLTTSAKYDNSQLRSGRVLKKGWPQDIDDDEKLPRAKKHGNYR
jgi:hypothetical protein